MRIPISVILVFSGLLLIGAVQGATVTIGPTQGNVEYKVTISYQASASATYPALTEAVTAAGTIITMPSGLIYSLQLETINSYSVQMQLEETNLSLIYPSNSSNLPIGIALVSLGLLCAAVFAAPSIFKRLKRKPATTPSTPGETDTDEKPPYWVD